MSIDIKNHPEIHDILVVQSKVFKDDRGWFTESYRQSWKKELQKFGCSYAWVQENISSSSKNTVRGLHYQIASPQAKWVRVVKGQALDVVVDLRKASPTFGKSTSILLNDSDGISLIIPIGFAHGFASLDDGVIFSYKCSDYYNPKGERGILWNDPSLNIDWSVNSPIISDKDLQLPLFSELTERDLF